MHDYDEWLHKLATLGVDAERARHYDTLTGAYAATTLHPNSEVVALCRQLALDALMRGEPMPDTPQEAVAAENARRIATAERLRKRFGVSS